MLDRFSNTGLTYEMCRVSVDPVTPLAGVLGVGGAEHSQQDEVVAGVRGGVTAPPGGEPRHLRVAVAVDKHTLRRYVRS